MKAKVKIEAKNYYKNKYNGYNQEKPKPKPKRCFGCGQIGHLSFQCKTPLPKTLPKHTRPFAHDSHYVINKDSKGRPLVVFLGPPMKNKPRVLWVAKELVDKAMGPRTKGVPKQQD